MTLFKHLFSLDTLDKRLTIPSQVPIESKREVDPAKPIPRTQLPAGASPSLWNTPEYYLYCIVVGIAVTLMFKCVYDVSQPSHPTYKNYEGLLSPGWVPGRKVDNSDGQYSGFRNNLPYLFILIFVHPLLRKVWNSRFPLQVEKTRNKQAPDSNGLVYSPEANARLEQRVGYDLVFALLFLCVLHGFSALKVLIIVTINYMIGKWFPRDSVVTLTWLFNIVTLFANELCKGYPYSQIARDTFPFTVLNPNSHWGTFFDQHSGLMPRWEILFNITVLRLISFNMDHHWSRSWRGQNRHLEKKQLDPSNLSDRDRVDISARSEDYNYRNYLAYVLYAPLYLAGPILTFNEYISQQRYVCKSIDNTRTVRYAIRFLVCLLTMELMQHYIYAVAISKGTPAWEIYTPFQLSMLGYFNLHFIWLKLLLPWRFFRLWALVDEIDPPENMVRCMSDNFSALAFWRGWHRSYNRWIVRYLYVPLGGSGQKGAFGVVRACVNYLAVFTFVALWHDIQLRLLMWGWLVSLFVLPEVFAHMVFPKRNFEGRKTQYRMIFGAVSVVLILMMMAANLVGFALGVDGLQSMLKAIFASYSGLVFLVAACFTLFVGVQVMFELREDEIRRGIVLKY